jgi:glycosyltransferase involved in cell wall biosynthesis
MKQALALDPKAIHLLHIAALDTHHYYKGTQDTIQAVGALPKKYHLHLVGTGNQREYYQDQITTHQLDHRCTFRQNLSPQQLKRLIFASDMVVQPSTSDAEGFGLSIIEAMSQQTLVVTTPVIALAPQLRGMVVFAPPHHPQGLAHMITNHTQPDLQLAREFGLSFNSKRMAQELDTLYSF